MSRGAEISRSPRLWAAVGLLLRLRLLISLRNFRRARKRQKAGMLILGLVILGGFGFVFYLSWLLLGFLQSPELAEFFGEVRPFLEGFPVLVLGGAFLGILLTSFGVLLQALYLAGDMEFLLSIPVPMRAVFMTKLLQAILPNLGLISLFALPVMYGLAYANHYSFLYYPSVLILLAALALAAAGISSLLVMGVVRLFPARRVAELLGFVGAVISMICSQSGQLARFGNFSQAQANQALQVSSRLNQPWSPIAWGARGLVEIGEGNWALGLGLFGLTVGLAVGIFFFSLAASERLYFSGWARMQTVQRRKRGVRAVRQPVASRQLTGLGAFIPSQVRAILGKDLLVMRRDLRNMSQLVTPLIIGIIYAIMLLRGGGEAPEGRGEAPAWFMEAMNNLMVYANVGLSLFVGWMLLGRLAGMGFSQEGKSYWMLKSAPLGTSHLIGAKFLVAYLPVVALSSAFLLVTWVLRRSDIMTLLFSFLVIALCTAGNAGLNLAFGILGANLAWEDPRQMQRTTSGCFGGLATMAYLPISLVLFFGPPLLAAALGLPVLVGQIAGLALGGVFSLACAATPPWLVRGRVARLGEG